MIDDKKFFEEQVEWISYRIRVLNTIEAKLKEMRTLAEYARDQQPDREDIALIQDKINKLHREIEALDQEHHKIVH
ncbi:hypothetical protein [Desertibacillus haloalkaliphilus]|uniref:hypothetical protein n=1 Tax=Desertibacillus haloalkaliphilus TaxID=1328930 RepID=UPI001C272BB1|nr:hypothetical protein [Desertibacillus haloalkaliphilus]MBU8907780.1 hypothetical protein [Desertibacillus haloalkaliphilus]